MPLAPGSRFGAYEVVAPLGAGGMGEVYRARDTRLSRDVALKILPAAVAKDPDRLTRFEREAKLLASLNHPNIATLYGLHEADGLHFLTMELVSGENLEKRLQDGPLTQEESLTYCEQIADALSATHARGVIHRDLKPANVIVTAEGRIKVLDFGLAKTLEATPSSRADGSSPTMSSGGTRAGVILGTAAYMSPEQARGLPLDERTDVWSFGCIFFELLTGRKIFGGATFSDSLAAVLTKAPPWGELPAGLPESVDGLLRRCLEKDSSSRLRDISEVRTALRSLATGSSSGSSAARRHSVDPSIAVLPFVNRSADPENEFFSDGLSEELIHALSRLHGLRVASRTSAFRYRGRDLDIRQIGRELGVQAVLEGSVRRAGPKLRVTAQLVNAADGYQLWSERYDREMADVFEIQDEITEAIAKTVAPTLLGKQVGRSKRHTENLEAYELYLKGRHFWHQRTESTLRAAIDCFQRAIGLDPSYALAHAGIADAFSILRPYGLISAREGRDRADTAAKTAMQLDPTLAESHFAAALVEIYYRTDWGVAEDHFRKAIELDPGSSMACAYYGFYLANVHRYDEARRQVDAALALDPLSPFVHALGGLILYLVDRSEEALPLAEKALAFHPDFALALWALGFAFCRLEQYAKAHEAFERLVLISKRAAIFVAMLGFEQALSGDRPGAMRVLAELDARKAEEYITPVAELLIYVGLGDRDRVVEKLLACIEDEVPPVMIETFAGPFSRELRSEPRTEELFRRLGVLPMATGARSIPQ